MKEDSLRPIHAPQSQGGLKGDRPKRRGALAQDPKRPGIPRGIRRAEGGPLSWKAEGLLTGPRGQALGRGSGWG